MIRSAAKNYKDVTIIVDVADYDTIIEKLKNHEISLATTSKLISDINVLYNFYDEDAKKYKIFQSNSR